MMHPIAKSILTIIALTLTLILTLMLSSSITTTTTTTTTGSPHHQSPNPASPAKKASRFLQQGGKGRNSKAADHCHKNEDICGVILDGARNATCCNNKCVDLGYDDDNCGACKKICAFTETCCRGECVNLAYDKRHCGECNHRCMPGGYCIYGLCDYA